MTYTIRIGTQYNEYKYAVEASNIHDAEYEGIIAHHRNTSTDEEPIKYMATSRKSLTID